MEQYRLLVLLAEDSELDFHAIRRCLSEVDPDINLEIVRDGSQCMQRLLAARKAPHNSGGELPDLLLLDLSMPEMDGFQVLRAVRATPGLKRLPIIVFANNPNQDEIQRCYELGANTVFSKPLGANNLIVFLDALMKYWSIAALSNSR